MKNNQSPNFDVETTRSGKQQPGKRRPGGRYALGERKQMAKIKGKDISKMKQGRMHPHMRHMSDASRHISYASRTTRRTSNRNICPFVFSYASRTTRRTSNARYAMLYVGKKTLMYKGELKWDDESSESE